MIAYQDQGFEKGKIMDYFELAKKVCKAIQIRQCYYGILISKTGLGISIVADKFKRLKRVPCYNEYTVKFGKKYYNSNLLALGKYKFNIYTVICILRMWIVAEYEADNKENFYLIEKLRMRI